MAQPRNLLALVDLVGRLRSVDREAPVVTDFHELLMSPMAGISPVPDEVAEIVVSAAPLLPTDAQTAATVEELFAPWLAREATHENPGTASPVVIAPLGEPARWVTDISYEYGQIQLHTVFMD